MITIGATKPKPPSDQPAAAKPIVNANAAGASTVPGIDPASSAEQIRQDSDQLRATVQKIGAGVGGVATVVLGAVGFTRADEIFVFPAGAPWPLAWGTGVAAACGLFGSAAFVARFYAAQRPIQIGSDLSGLHKPWIRPPASLYLREYDWVVATVDKQVRDLGETNLYEMDLRANRLARIARRLDPDWEPNDAEPRFPSPNQRLAVRARRESIRVEDTMRYVLLRIAGALLQRRADRTFGSKSSMLLIALAVGGITFTFGVGDWAKGQRTLERDKVLRVQDCQRDIPKTSPDQAAALMTDCLNAAATPPPTTTAGK